MLMTRKLNCAGIVSWIIMFFLGLFSVFIRPKVICSLSHITFMIYRQMSEAYFIQIEPWKERKNQCWRDNREIYPGIVRMMNIWHCLFSALLINEGRPKRFLTIDANSVKDWKPHKRKLSQKSEWMAFVLTPTMQHPSECMLCTV